VKREIRFGMRRLRRGPVLRFIAWSVPEAAPAAVLGLAVARSVDDGFLAGRPAIGLAWLSLVLVAGLVSAVGSRQVLRALGELVEPVRDELVERVIGAALRRAVEGKPDDGAVARLTRQVEIVRDSYGGLLLTIRGSLISMVAATAGVLSLSPLIASLVMPPFLVGVLAFVACLGISARWHREAVVADERLSAAAGTVLAGVRDIVATGSQRREAARVHGPIVAQATAERALARAAMIRTACFAVGGWIPLLTLLVAGPWLIGRGVSTGAILGGLTYVLFGLQPALSRLMSGVGVGAVRYIITLGRLLDLPEIMAPERVAVGRTDGRLILRGVGFAYGPHSTPVLDGLDLDIPDGDHLAIIGPSGIGKSTLASLLCGLSAPTRGSVQAGAIPVLIPQEAYVFTGTLRENLCYLSDTDPAQAVAVLGAQELVQRLGGYDAPVDPARLSAGERQLISLVRAYLSPSPIAVLDEATCHLDPSAEAMVERAFARRPGTLVVIAHRLSSALRARRILVLDGESATLGDHASLLERSDLYRRLMGTDLRSSPSPSPAGSPRSWSGSQSSPAPATDGSVPSRG
jgi:ATP-binding cassette subfamily C protein